MKRSQNHKEKELCMTACKLDATLQRVVAHKCFPKILAPDLADMVVQKILQLVRYKKQHCAVNLNRYFSCAIKGLSHYLEKLVPGMRS